MKMLVFDMEIIDELPGTCFVISVTHLSETTTIRFTTGIKKLQFMCEDSITRILQRNEYQVRKILHNKREDTFYKGFRLKFAIRDNKEVAAFNDKSKIIVLDRRDGKNESYVIDKGEECIHKIFTDGCYLWKDKRGAYVALIKSPEDQYDLFTGQIFEKNSSHLELFAAIKGLEKLRDIEKVRIITDSRYVIKGLTEWCLNWKLNDWHTAQGRKVQNIETWQQFDILTENKYIEFQWVKAHAFHPENTICDFYAKQVAHRTV